jgi:adenylate kinase
VRRLTARRQCPKCRRIYNLLSQPPRSAGVCDDDGAALFTREDDTEEVILRRMQAYRDQTGPVLKWYGSSAVRTIDGGMAPELVARAVAQAVEESWRAAVSRER